MHMIYRTVAVWSLLCFLSVWAGDDLPCKRADMAKLLKGDKPVTREEVMARPLHSLPDFTSMTMEQMLHFFSRGKTKKGKDERGFATVYPKGMKNLSPKEAALAYAEVNRTSVHKKNYQLVVDDRHKVAPPKQGWLVYTQHSASCYTFIQWLWALNLDDPCLI